MLVSSQLPDGPVPYVLLLMCWVAAASCLQEFGLKLFEQMDWSLVKVKQVEQLLAAAGSSKVCSDGAACGAVFCCILANDQ